MSEQLDAIQQRADATSPGPWTHEPYGGQNQNGDYAGGNVFDGTGEYLVAEVSDADGTFIAHAWDDIPMLLSIVRGLTPRVLKGDWETVRDALHALPHLTIIRWHSHDGRTVAIKRHGRWYEAGYSVARFTESIARDETPIEVIA